MLERSSVSKLKRIGNHALLTDRLLGKGHYGKVYLGHDLKKTQELYACKVIDRCDKKFNAHAEDLVQNEIENLSLVRSPHIISLKQHYKTKQHYYIFTELCNGGDLGLLKKSRPGGRLSEDECRVVMKKLVSGLRDLYEFDILHRDLKLANILLHFPLEEALEGEKGSKLETLLAEALVASD